MTHRPHPDPRFGAHTPNDGASAAGHAIAIELAPGSAHDPNLRTSQDPDAGGDQAPIRRPEHIRSFTNRRVHFTQGQRAAHARLLPLLGIAYGPLRLDARRAFGRDAPLVLEIGFGMGETTAQIARTRPEHDFLGIEVYPAGVGALLRRLDNEAIGNVRVIQHDAVEVLRDMIAPDMLAGVHVYFPDPWPKSRHHKRRLIQPPLVALLASRLAPGGYLHCATDWEPYAEQMLTVLSAEPALRNTAQGYAPRPDWRPLTKFEKRGMALGHPVRDLMFERVTATA